jgi:hypothetical protein
MYTMNWTTIILSYPIYALPLYNYFNLLLLSTNVIKILILFVLDPLTDIIKTHLIHRNNLWTG